MAGPSVTYTFTNLSTADGPQVSTNFSDLINAMSDGTKDFSIGALTAAGTATLNGAVTLGNSSSKDITFTGSLASSIPIKTTNSYDFGSATLGLRSIYLADSASNARTTRILGAAVASSWTLTLPTGVGTANQSLRTDGAGVTSFKGDTLVVASKVTTYSATVNDDLILCSGSAFTVTLPAATNTGKVLTIKKTDSSFTNIITIARAGSDTIDGATSTTLNSLSETLVLVADGTATWSILGRTYDGKWISYTPTFSAGLGGASVSLNNAEYRRVNDGIQVRGRATTATVGATVATLTLPTGLNVDTTKFGATALVGAVTRVSAADMLKLNMISTDTNALHISASLTDSNGSSILNSTEAFSWYADVPISGWN